MSVAQLIHIYQSLPRHLQEKVQRYLQSLQREINTQGGAETSEMVLTIEEAPDPSAIFGLTKDNPLSLDEIRKTAWER